MLCTPACFRSTIPDPGLFTVTILLHWLLCPGGNSTVINVGSVKKQCCRILLWLARSCKGAVESYIHGHLEWRAVKGKWNIFSFLCRHIVWAELSPPAGSEPSQLALWPEEMSLHSMHQARKGLWKEAFSSGRIRGLRSPAEAQSCSHQGHPRYCAR